MANEQQSAPDAELEKLFDSGTEEVVNEVPDLYEIFGRNVDAEKAGVWINVAFNGKETDMQVKVRSFRSEAGRKYTRLRDAAVKMAKKTLKPGQKLSEDAERAINAEAFVRAGLVSDWKNIMVKQKEIVFTVEEAIKLLSNPVFDVFFAWLLEQVTSLDAFKNNAREEEAKN
jgi:hypothetical protein